MKNYSLTLPDGTQVKGFKSAKDIGAFVKKHVEQISISCDETEKDFLAGVKWIRFDHLSVEMQAAASLADYQPRCGSTIHNTLLDIHLKAPTVWRGFSQRAAKLRIYGYIDVHDEPDQPPWVSKIYEVTEKGEKYLNKMKTLPDGKFRINPYDLSLMLAANVIKHKPLERSNLISRLIYNGLAYGVEEGEEEYENFALTKRGLVVIANHASALFEQAIKDDRADLARLCAYWVPQEFWAKILSKFPAQTAAIKAMIPEKKNA